MYKYKIGYHTYEGGDVAELEHDQLFTEEELTVMITEAIADLLPGHLRDTVEGLDDFKDGSYPAYCFKLDNFFPYGETGVIAWLIRNKGFVRIKYDVSWIEFGWASILSEDDWSSARKNDDELARLTMYLKRKGISKEKYKIK